MAAARALIVEVGYANAQLEEIAERAGLTKGAIYSIFGGKRELLRAVVDEHARDVFPLLDWSFDADATVTAEDLIEHLVAKYLAFLDRPGTTRLLAFEVDLNGLALRDPDILALVLAHEQSMAQRLAGAIAGRDRRDGPVMSAAAAAVAADMLLGALGGIGQRLVTSPWMARDPKTIAAAIGRLLPPHPPTRH